MIGLALLAGVAYRGAMFKVDVRAWEDGRDLLVLSGKSLHWVHESYAIPGVQEGHHDPTRVTVSWGKQSREMAWYPTWPHGTGNGAVSSSFNGLPKSLGNAALVDFKIIHARESAAIAQLPVPSNGFETVAELDDSGIFGADNYEIELTYVTLSKRKLRALYGPGYAKAKPVKPAPTLSPQDQDR